MRVGILTFHAAHNYGAVLQCYALQTYLKLLGNRVSIIDHRIPEMLKVYECFSWKRIFSRNPIKFIRNLIMDSKRLPWKYQRFKKFNFFIQHHLVLETEGSINTTPYDVIIVGSDQVWNTKLTRGFDKFYWGEFKRPKKTKVCSYAASMEDNWNAENEQIIVNRLSNFDKISVREISIATKLQALTESRIVNVVDPTLLISSVEWSKMASPRIIKEPYLFLYQVETSQNAESIAKFIAKKMGLKIIYLSARIDEINSKECISASPCDFISLFKYADFTVCSSFHGTIFSLIFSKPFYSIRMNNGKDCRIEDLLRAVGLENRFINKKEECKELQFLYNCNDALSEIRKKSYEYINSIIHE